MMTVKQPVTQGVTQRMSQRATLDDRRMALCRLGACVATVAGGAVVGSGGVAMAAEPPAQELVDGGWTEIVPDAVVAAAPAPVEDVVDDTRRSLRLVNAHTGERLEVVYQTRGIYIDESMQAIAHLMRDHRAGESIPIDPLLIDELFMVHQVLGTDEPLHILSGYRTPQTNARLRSRSSGVAKYSLHMEGRAADIYVPGIKTRTLREAALSLKAGGVGFYSKSGFVHIDTGEVRAWGA